MDKQAILKLFRDNTSSKTEPSQAPVQVLNHGNMVIQYGDNSTATTGCTVNDNRNLTAADKQQVHDLIDCLERKNQKEEF
ncbi:TPA: hypothetical protein ACU207_002455 [Mannheimia haemolytica]|uniref:hypothetical protein n=1 Tax=Mannheimia haemolytica TaxID=75985 RepID=UPI001CF3667E|nr:hypothetical protein [Mannheimia haemolytica]MCB4228098.1 hypothetical protein [Mannheimia haemolytica]MEE3732226.1 hypothetical protein [Mannheimia haemolytica]